MKQKVLSVFSVIFIAIVVLTVSSCDQLSDILSGNVVIDIKDSNLQTVLEETLGKEDSESIYAKDVLTVTRLDASYRNVGSLKGLEYFVALEELNLSGNSEIAEFLPLYSLRRLNTLIFYENSNFSRDVVNALRIVLPHAAIAFGSLP